MTLLYDKNFLFEKAKEYCREESSAIVKHLGHGTQGMVFQTSRNSAIKVYNLQHGYSRERDVYKRLKERDIELIGRFKVPRIMHWDDSLYVLEMSIVHVPCVLDFGGAYLDNCPEHLPHRSEEWENEMVSQFGSNWQEAKKIIRELELKADVWLADINTGNIKFDKP